MRPMRKGYQWRADKELEQGTREEENGNINLTNKREETEKPEARCSWLVKTDNFSLLQLRGGGRFLLHLLEAAPGAITVRPSHRRQITNSEAKIRQREGGGHMPEQQKKRNVGE